MHKETADKFSPNFWKLQWCRERIRYFFFLQDGATVLTANWDHITTCPLWPACSLNLTSCSYYLYTCFTDSTYENYTQAGLLHGHTRTHTCKHNHTDRSYLAHNTENFRWDFKQIWIVYSPSVKHVWKLQEVFPTPILTQVILSK
jgi:hypothetical protein